MKYAINTAEDVRNLARVIHAQERPFRVAIKEGGDRSLEQNRTAWLWAQDIFNQRPDMESAQYVHSFNKLHFGVAIRKEDDDFREKYDRIIKPLDYEAKLELMAPPIDFPVTRDMGVKQMGRFLDAVWQHWTGEGLALTDTEAV